MASLIRSHRVGIAAGALTLALVAPSIVVPQGIAQDTTATETATETATTQAAEPVVIDWESRHPVTFVGDTPTVVENFMLPAGSTIQANVATDFNWTVEANEDGSVVLQRPNFDVSFTEGEKDVAVTVTLPDETTVENVLKVAVTKRPDDSREADPDLSTRFETENFWNQDSAVVTGLEVDPNYTFAPTANTIFNWGFTNDGGTLTVKRPQAAVAFRQGDVSIPVKITRGDGTSYTSTLNLSVIDEMPKAEWEGELPDLAAAYNVDFEGEVSKVVEELTLPEGVTVKKKGVGPLGWSVSAKDGKVQVNAPNNFIPGTFDIPVVFSDGTSEVERTLHISAKNPATPSEKIADIVADFIGKVGGGLLGGLTGGGLLGGGGAGGEGGGGVNVEILSNNGNPNVIVTDNAKAEIKDNLSNNGNPVITDNAKVDIKDNLSNNGNPVITDNAKATVEIKDNLSNNGNPVITDNAKVNITDNAKATVEIKDNLSNNGNPVITDNAKVNISDNAKADVKITDNAKATVEIKDNLSNNGNPDVKISDNAKADVNVSDNAKATVVITDNANPEVKDNLSNNGNPEVKISDNAKADVKITGNANPEIKDNLNNNGNPDVKITDNAKAEIKDNANPVVTNNANPTVVITGNANPEIKDNLSNNGNPDVKISDNAKATVEGIPLSSGGGSSKDGKGEGGAGNGQGAGGGKDGSAQGGSSNLNANVGMEGGSSDPRCVATLIGLGLPLLALIPLALSTQLAIPGLEQAGKQLTRTLNDVARSAGVSPEALAGIGGGVIGLVVAIIAIAGGRSCVPSVRDVDVQVGSAEKPANEAPVVSTDEAVANTEN